MWTPTTRRHHSRAGLRYGSDLTDCLFLELDVTKDTLSFTGITGGAGC